MKAICIIDNKQVQCEIIDNNYNDHAKEVKILEGIHTGRFAIVENKDIKIKEFKTVNQLTKLIKSNVSKEDLEEDLFIELVDYDIMEIVENFAKNLTLTNKEYYTLTDVYGVYNNCNSREEVKLNLLIDVITKQLDGCKISYTNFKKTQIKNSL